MQPRRTPSPSGGPTSITILWEEFVKRHHLPSDSPEPTCKIPLSPLSIIAQEFAEPENSFRGRRESVDDVPIELSSSPTLLFSSSSEANSEDEKRRDPTYKP